MFVEKNKYLLEENKAAFHLWHECLKRSEVYWAGVHVLAIEAFIEREMDEEFVVKLLLHYDEKLGHRFQNIPNKNFAIRSFAYMAAEWCGIELEGFDSLWAMVSSHKLFYTDLGPPPVMTALEALKREAEVFGEMRKRPLEKVSVQEFLEHLEHGPQTYWKLRANISISPDTIPLRALRKEVDGIVSNVAKKVSPGPAMRWKQVCGDVYPEEISRYLGVWDLMKEGFTARQILDGDFPYIDEFSEEVRKKYKGRASSSADPIRAIRRDKQNGQALIRNAENGFFPCYPELVEEKNHLEQSKTKDSFYLSPFPKQEVTFSHYE